MPDVWAQPGTPQLHCVAAPESQSAPAVPSRALPPLTEEEQLPALESSFAMPPPPGFWAEQSFHGLGRDDKALKSRGQETKRDG